MASKAFTHSTLSRYFASFSRMGVGNLAAKLWICGIEHGSDAEALYDIAPECEPGEWDIEKQTAHAAEYRECLTVRPPALAASSGRTLTAFNRRSLTRDLPHALRGRRPLRFHPSASEGTSAQGYDLRMRSPDTKLLPFYMAILSGNHSRQENNTFFIKFARCHLTAQQRPDIFAQPPP
jgi:hypothetical protein